MKPTSFTPLGLLLVSTALTACSGDDTTSSVSSTSSSSAAGSTAASSTSGSGSGGGGGSSGNGGSGGGGGGGGGGSAALCDDSIVGGNRPVTLHVPSSYACGTPAPLVILLHGYTSSGSGQELYFGLTAESEKHGFFYAYPDGTKDSAGNGFWNATDACCNFEGAPVDDSSYIASLIDEIASKYAVDTKRVYLVGHSNGGFMSYRAACDHADKITAIASLAGAMFADVSKCNATEPVSVLQIHGTADAVILYNGGALGQNPYPAAKTSADDWAAINQCPGDAQAGAPLDLDSSLAGTETTVSHRQGCAKGTTAALWTIEGGSHVPSLSMEFAPEVVKFLLAQKKP
jgi:polyhydroxybutyrate depolymerase